MSQEQEVIKFFSAVLDSCEKFHEQLVKAIEVKKKLLVSASGNMALNQAQDVLNTISNLDKIKLELSGAVGELKQLNQQALLLLQPAQQEIAFKKVEQSS